MLAKWFVYCPRSAKLLEHVNRWLHFHLIFQLIFDHGFAQRRSSDEIVER